MIGSVRADKHIINRKLFFLTTLLFHVFVFHCSKKYLQKKDGFLPIFLPILTRIFRISLN